MKTVLQIWGSLTAINILHFLLMCSKWSSWKNNSKKLWNIWLNTINLYTEILYIHYSLPERRPNLLSSLWKSPSHNLHGLCLWPNYLFKSCPLQSLLCYSNICCKLDWSILEHNTIQLMAMNLQQHHEKSRNTITLHTSNVFQQSLFLPTPIPPPLLPPPPPLPLPPTPLLVVRRKYFSCMESSSSWYWWYFSRRCIKL